MDKSPFQVTLLRTPVVSSAGSLSFSTLVPPLALAYLSAALRKAGFHVYNIDAIGEDSAHTDRIPGRPHMEYQGLSIEEIIQRISPSTDVLGVSCMFSS